ncbi:MAG: transposase [Bacteroidota bacterium]
MSRKTAYIAAEGEYFHVYNRGVNRNQIFFSARNYRYFLERMSNGLNKSSVSIIAYCLMPNHFHFILFQQRPSGISDFIKSICDGYSKAINKDQERSGHLFEGKYKIKLIDSDEYLLHLSRYIHLNPVRAHLTTTAEAWEYSSAGVYFGIQTSGLVDSAVIFRQTGGSPGYRKFVEEYIEIDRMKISNLLFS